MGIKKTVVLLCLGLFFGASSAQSFWFERRPRPPAQTSYFVYPVSGKIPGVVEEFSGIGVSGATLFGTQADVSYFNVQGEAQHYDDPFKAQLLTFFDVPLFNEHLTLSGADLRVENGAWPEGDRGMRSDPDHFYYLLGQKFRSWGADLSLQFFDYQLEFYYGIADGSVVPYGLIDPQGNFYAAEEARLIENPRGYRWGLYLDDTDDRRDPRLGYRLQYERWGIPQTREDNASYYQEDYNLTLFVPNEAHSQVLVLNGFFSSSTVVDPGTVERARYQCPTGEPHCQAALDKLYENQLENAQKGKSTALGGTLRLRGYPTNRFFDAYSAFWGVELRSYWLEEAKAFDFLVEKGVFAALQTALFYEEGTVAPTADKLWSDRRNSYGVGLRVVLSSVVLRGDVGFSDEGHEVTLLVGYPF